MPLSKLFPCFQFRLDDNINKLDYSNNVFPEEFPQVWQYEQTLEELNVTSTRINNLPPQLFYCRGLKVLLANNNSLENLPDAVGSLRQLQKLCLNKNFISNVPDNIKSCKNLTHLDLSCNSLQKLPDAITYLISLQELILNETYLEYLPANFGRLVNLRIVELRSNNLISLPKSMQRLTNLQRLDIGCNEFTKIPEVIGELRQLQEFWFDFNQIENLPLQIGKLRELIHCEMNGNRLTCLPNEIGKWRNLEVLSISTNNLQNLPFNIGMFKLLVVLKCESNELINLPDSISNLENLEELVVSHNKLVRLPNSIGMLKKLRYLFADDNNLQILPDEICSCFLLSVLSISQNKISKLPINMGNLTNLKVLNIVQNNISTLPVTLLSLRNLASLWICDNQSKPLIPLQYTDLSKKAELTCFMLPQQKRIQKETINNTNTFQIEQISNEVASSSVSKRRICFAEEPSILNSNAIVDQSASSVPISLNTDYLNSNKTVLPINYRSFEQKDKSQDFLLRSPTPYPKDLRIMSKDIQSNKRNSLKHEHLVISHDKRDENSSPLNSNERNLDCSRENYERLQNSQANLNKEYMGNYYDIIHKGNYNGPFVEDKLPKPPPYRVARCFIKKSINDLTSYDYKRKSQEQYNINFENNQLIFLNNNSKNLEIANTCEVKYDSQNNLMLSHTTYDDGNSKSITIRKGIENTNKRHINVKSDIECTNTLQPLNIPKTGWLFGAHRNLRVIQVNINSESNRHFEIDVLPNKEGIYVISTVSKSCASKILQPGDKILEVDGVDFTNININEARNILNTIGPSISMMLSRK
ncbi:leucine rich repeat containing protein 7 lap1 [Cochliomyia hominivorax]